MGYRLSNADSFRRRRKRKSERRFLVLGKVSEAGFVKPFLAVLRAFLRGSKVRGGQRSRTAAKTSQRARTEIEGVAGAVAGAVEDGFSP